jgi:3-(3-hydroxy-phenyl)propionate hydroxylase
LTARVNKSDRVVIAGAGPVGLTAAYALLRQGIPVILLESYADLPTDPRASTFHPPTMELLESLEVADEVHGMGLEVAKWQFRDLEEGLVAEFDLSALADITRYPFRLHCEQHKYARMLLGKIEKMGGCEIRKSHTVASARQDENGVVVTADGPEGPEDVVGRYLIGCDGGKSPVRHAMGVSFKGRTFEERFLVLTTPFDYTGHGFGGTCYIADPDRWYSMFKVPADGPPGHWRVVSPVEAHVDEATAFDDDACQRRIQAVMPHPDGGTFPVLHKNLYPVHQRIAGRFAKGNIFLAGDAAHINNPLGGMGLNFGIHDALNLAEKISAVNRGDAKKDIFHLYDRQRRTVAEEYLLAQTAQNKRDLEERDPEARTRRQQEWRKTAANPQAAREFLLRTAMFKSVERARSIQ